MDQATLWNNIMSSKVYEDDVEGSEADESKGGD